MAEKQSSSLDLKGKISTVDANIKSIFDARKNIIAKLYEADKAGDAALAQQLADESVTLSRALERQEAEYTLLQEQEAKPELERIGKLRRELENQGRPAYSPIGGVVISNDPNPPTKERQREIVAELFNAKKGSRESEQLPVNVRAGVGALPTPEGELEYLKRTYPNANIVPFDAAGQTEYLIKNQDGTSLTTLDKGVAGTAGMLAVEAPIALGSTAAGIATAIGTRSPVTATAVAGGTEAALGTAADAITRAALGMPQQFGEDVSRRGLQAGIGTALGLGIDVVPSAMIANRVPSKFQNEFLQQFQGSAERLGLDYTSVPAGAQFGPQGLAAGEDLSGLFNKQNTKTSCKNKRR